MLREDRLDPNAEGISETHDNVGSFYSTKIRMLRDENCCAKRFSVGSLPLPIIVTTPVASRTDTEFEFSIADMIVIWSESEMDFLNARWNVRTLVGRLSESIACRSPYASQKNCMCNISQRTTEGSAVRFREQELHKHNHDR